MKVLQINSVCGVGSTGRIAADLYSAVTEAGGICKIAYGRNLARNVLPADTIKIGTNADVYAHALMSRITDRTAFYSTSVTKNLVSRIAEYAPDIVHLHNLHGYYINIEILFNYLKSGGVPVVWTLHDCWAFTGHCAHFDAAGCSKWQTGCGNCPQKNVYPKSILADNSEGNFKKKQSLFTGIESLNIVTPSNWLADLTRRSFLGCANIEVISNGIDTSVFTPFTPSADVLEGKHSSAGKFTVLGAASVWEERKGLADFIKLSKLLDDRYKIVLVGLTDKQISSLPSNITGIKRTNSIQELAQLYSSAAVFVNPTYQDTFPTTNLEALACGTPVITYNTGGSVESINDSCGIVVKKGDAEALKSAVEQVVSGAFDRRVIAAYGEGFDKRLMCERYMKLYERLCE